MAGSARLPRATDDYVVVSKDTWNLLCDTVESGIIQSVTPPLELRRTPAGTTLALRDVAGTVRVKLTSAVSGQTGRYNGRIFQGAVNTAATGGLVEANLGTLPTSDDCVVWLATDVAASSASISTFPAYATGRVVGQTSAGLRIVLVSGGGGGINVQFIKVTADWTPGTNTISGLPCSIDGTLIDGGVVTKISLLWPRYGSFVATSTPPPYCPFVVDDIVAYVPFSTPITAEVGAALPFRQYPPSPALYYLFQTTDFTSTQTQTNEFAPLRISP